ncbi:Fe(2+) transporter permease subunit FeoB [Pantoea cypripedii]|uniref:Ferrous iron transport protein B n=1 Tax=Pantoea cypripedii TaxID=55209 RepID=A0A1X1EM65_PANCY|nr:Fe(2+) transporter permease subunit FeoB [Pantoea cypripedii]MBP2200380.1 ferrous iron transport protein B [Pantoea cypripedii]ORM89912.1 ferrous iron transport protein B [Pantoea cypripedii]
MKKLIIGLIGNPNTGKTTLFNQLTGARQRVGNWAGVTVERKEGQFFTAASDVHLIDLPGTRSLTTISADTSIDESIACQYLFNDQADLVINVVDASNLESNLFLTVQLLELGVPCIIALNMQDIAASQNISIDIDALSRRLGCPVVSLTSTRGEGIARLKETIDHHHHQAPVKWVAYPAGIETMITRLRAMISSAIPAQKQYWLALQLLEGDLNSQKICPEVVQHLPEISKEAGGDPGMVIADYRFRAITDLCSTVSNIHQSTPGHLTGMIDKVVLNRWAGIPIFLGVMYLMFVLSINIGAALQPVFDSGSVAVFIHGTQWLGYTFHFPDWLTVFLAQGIGAGINTVLPIIPQIGLMYLFLSFLEDSGYMARAAFVMDRLMQALGLPGKSFVPLIVGFGCNVPSVMGARTLDTPRERLITVLIAPFMSCGARLAIFAVFAAAFFGAHSASLVFSLYVLGIAVAIITGLILKHTLLRGEASPFIMELPVYHRPHLKSLLIQTWQRLKMFIIRAGRVIILVSMIIGVLSSFSFNGNTVNNINDSALAATSKVITPILQPIGVTDDNWQATVGLVTGIMAKEVVVGTLNSLYTGEDVQSGGFNPEEFNLLTELTGSLTATWEGLKAAVSLGALANPIEASKGDGEMAAGQMGVMSAKFGSVFAAYSYLIFVLLYVPCVSVMGAIAREAGRNWMLFSFFWGLNVAFSIATLFYQSVTFSAHPAYSAICLFSVVIVNVLLIALLRKWGKRIKEHRLNIPVAENGTGCAGCKGCCNS